ncbi:transposable element Tcb2 transposase [Trichonephila clavipes]|nr:transposable element Tcb2 transposase [Trichonephila clavipes]
MDRLNWCKEHQNWTEHQWSHVLFTDESQFSLTGDSTSEEHEMIPRTLWERDRFSSGGFMDVFNLIYRDEVLGSLFVQSRGMPNSPSQMIPDVLDWRLFWESYRPRTGSNSVETVM